MLQPSYHRNINPLRPLALRPHISAGMPIHNYGLSIVFPVEICQVIFICVSVLLSAKPRFIGIVINFTGWGLFSLPNRRKSAEKVEIPRATVRISLPKQQKSAERVEIPRATVRISLPKQRKSVEKVENPRATVRKSLPKQWKSAEKGRDSKSHRPDISTQTAEIRRKRYFRTVIFYKSCVYMIKYTH